MATVGLEVEKVDGVRLQVVKLGGWLDVQANRHKLTTGITFAPMNTMCVNLPVEVEGDLTIEQLAELLKKTLEIYVPTAKVFVNQAEIDFKGDDF